MAKKSSIGRVMFSSTITNRIESIGVSTLERKHDLIYKKDRDESDIIANLLFKAADRMRKLMKRSEEMDIIKR